MREIKFREFINGIFHYWGFVQEGLFKGPVTPSLTRGFHSQFTGLKDKNGKEIYEGDIVKCHDHPTGIKNAIGEVNFDQGRYWISKNSICSLDDYGTTWTEIIGNIYETPELLK